MRNLKIVAKALLIVALFVDENSFGAAAQIIADAREKLAGRNRTGAIALLLNAIKHEWTAARRDELEAELKRATEIFMTNEGQRLFELAESSRNGGKLGYLAQYEEALKVETQNSKVLIGYILALMSTRKCKAAGEPLALLENVNPYTEEYKLLKFRFEICTDPKAITAAKEVDLETVHELAIFKKTAKAQAAFLKGQYETALTLARTTTKIDDRFPAPYYWAWKVLARDNAGLDEAQRYLSLCKNLSTDARRKYSLEPELCGNTDEVEEFLRDEESGKHAH